MVLTSYSAYRGLRFHLVNILPQTDDTILYMRLSTDGGSSYNATGYLAQVALQSSATVSVQSSTIGFQLTSSTGTGKVSNVAGEGGYTGHFDLWNFTSLSTLSLI